MNGRAATSKSLHPDRLDFKRLGWAFAISLALHLGTWGGYEAGHALNLWEKLRLPPWLAALKPPAPKKARENPIPPPAKSEPPLVFVEVNPMVATTEPPEDAKFYSDKNSKAANPEADKETDIPKIAGTQTQVPKTETTDRNKFDQLQPSRPPEPVEEKKPEPQPQMGDLALAKPDQTSAKETPTERSRPRTVQEAKMRQQLTRIPGEKMKQDGGVRRRLEFASLDTRATPFGAYDAAFVEAVSQRWYDLLDARQYASDGHGKVVVRFRLKYDGTITDLQVANTSVDTILTYLCNKAISDPAPYERWPSDMRRLIEKDYREIQFTFYYN